MPTITQMVYLENYTRHLTEIRHQVPQNAVAHLPRSVCALPR